MKKLMSLLAVLAVVGLQARHGGHHEFGEKPKCVELVEKCVTPESSTVEFCPQGTKEDQDGRCYTERVVRDYHCKDKQTTYHCPAGTQARR